MHRNPPEAVASAWNIVDRAEIAIFLHLRKNRRTPRNDLVARSATPVQRLPFGACSVISPPFIARLIKGCRVDACADYLVSK
jgi:hypothetical protein